MFNNKEWENELKDQKEQILKLQAASKKWGVELNKIHQLRTIAQEFEKKKMLPEAIAAYQESILFGRNNESLNLSNYVFDIERVIILYSKTKQKMVLFQFLSEIISLYPSYRDIEKWKIRLQKLQSGHKTI